MKRLVYTFAIVLAFGSGSLKTEAKELRVLFIGNSLTYTIQSTIDNLIQSSPYAESTFAYVAYPSWRLQQHVDNDYTIKTIRNHDWDFVVLQEHSAIPTLPNRSQEFYNAVAKLSEIIKESGAQVILYLTWGGDNFGVRYPQVNLDYETMQQRLVAAYTQAMRNVDAIIAPVGLAWERVRMHRPDLGYHLYTDHIHPSSKGAFLAACVFYITLFDADPAQLGYNGSLVGEEAAYLRRKAKEVFIPKVDFNDDGNVDINDLLRLIESWGQDDPVVDMGPMPWGDGIVDATDLEVLMSYWGQEPYDPHLLAHWKLDETEGDVAYDSAAENDATVMGDAIWQPGQGAVDGALQFDGIDDCVSTDPVLNPADGVFSVFAWIKGGAPGQVIISQESGASWLKVDSLEGRLISELNPARGRGPLESQTMITDGNWHRIGFIWGDSQRALYVDDVVVAHDTRTGFKGSDGGLYIGAGKGLEMGSFWSGMIDDVRIYERVVEP